MPKTTIQLEQKTVLRLKDYKQFDRQSYDEILNAILDNSEEDTLTAEEIEDLQDALEQVKKGKLISIEDLSKELGVKL